jgi:Uma2 family endonuclease
MAGSVIFEDRLELPLDLGTLAEFRRWAVSDDYPERGRVDFIGGRIEVDMSPENLYLHGTPKTELIRGLAQRVKDRGTGSLFSDSTRISCPSAELSAEPDLVYLTEHSIQSGAVRLVPSARETGFIEIEGGPDLVVEIVSDSSVVKDTRRLPAAYFAAGVREYWLVDARGAELSFIIQARGTAGFEPVPRDADGFQPSAVLGCRYRFERRANQLGRWMYDLRELP